MEKGAKEEGQMTGFYDRRAASIRGYVLRRLKKNETIPLREVVAWAQSRHAEIRDGEITDIVQRVLQGTAKAKARKKADK